VKTGIPSGARPAHTARKPWVSPEENGGFVVRIGCMRLRLQRQRRILGKIVVSASAGRRTRDRGTGGSRRDRRSRAQHRGNIVWRFPDGAPVPVEGRLCKRFVGKCGLGLTAKAAWLRDHLQQAFPGDTDFPIHVARLARTFRIQSETIMSARDRLSDVPDAEAAGSRRL